MEDTPGEVMQYLAYEVGVLTPKDVRALCLTCRALNFALHGNGDAFDLCQHRALAGVRECVRRGWEKAAVLALKRGFVADGGADGLQRLALEAAGKGQAKVVEELLKRGVEREPVVAVVDRKVEAAKNQSWKHTSTVAAAVAAYRAVLPIRRLLFGPESKATAEVLFLLGRRLCHSVLGDQALAEGVGVLEALDGMQARLGYDEEEEYPGEWAWERLEVMQTLGRGYKKMGRWDDAVKKFEDALDVMSETDIDTDPGGGVFRMRDYIDKYIEIFRVYEVQEKWEKALAVLAECEGMMALCSIDDYAEPEVVMQLKIRVLFKMGRMDDVQRTFEELVEACDSIYYEDMDVGNQFAFMGGLYAEHGMWEEAEAKYKEALDCGSDFYVLFELSKVLEKQGKFDSSMERYREAVIARDTFFHNNPHHRRLLQVLSDTLDL